MKRIYFFLNTFLILNCIDIKTFAGGCKPDYSQIDQITKKPIIVWQQTIYETSFGSSMINTSEVNIDLSVGRFGNINAIRITIQKQEESTQNASFESQYKAIKGNDFVLAFKEGEPLKFISSEVGNNSKVDNVFGKLITTVVLSKTMTDAEIITFKDKLTTNNLDAIRITLSNSITIEKTVKDGKSNKMKDKFICYYNYVAENPMKVEVIPIHTFSFPFDSITKKYNYTSVIPVNGASKEQLYTRGKNWMINYFKDSQIGIDNKEDGQLTRKGTFIKKYSITKNGNVHEFTITLKIKDGKYKYEITDMFFDKGSSQSLEVAAELIHTHPITVQEEFDKTFSGGINEILDSLKKAMESDVPKEKSDW